MRTARTAALVTWIYIAAFGIPAVPVAVYLYQNKVLPQFGDAFTMYFGPWSERFGHDVLVVLLITFLLVALFAAYAAWLLWSGSRVGAWSA